jgi:iron complex outermembrane receptor protein
MINPRKSLLAGTSAISLAILAAPALAQSNTAAGLETVIVTGRRISQASEAIGENEVTNTVAVTRQALLSAPSGISGLKMLETLPGFNVQTDGSLGLYEFGNSLQTRAFDLTQIGFVVDGIPTGRSDPFGGSPVFRYVDNENLAAVSASPGAGDVSMPSYSSLGPMVEYRSIAPQTEFGAFVSESLGDNDMTRNFVRLSTGVLGPFTAYVSRTQLRSHLWRGAGSVNRKHWEGQVFADLGGSSWARFKFVANNFYDNDSPTLTRGEYNCTADRDALGNCGRDFAYIGVVQDLPETVPGVRYSNSGYTSYYGLAVNHRDDKLYGLTLHVGASDNLYTETTLYLEDKNGFGVSPDSYSNSNGRYLGEAAVGLPVVAPLGVQYGLSGVGGDRAGVTEKVHGDFENHAVEAGIWVEQDKYHRTQLRYNTTDGSPASQPDFAGGPVYLRRDYHSKRNTTQLFIKDKISLLDESLVVDIGVKALFLDYQLQGYRDYADYYRTTTTGPVAGWGPQYNDAHYEDALLPELGLLYKLPDQRTQIFASFSKNMALPKGMDDIYSVAFNDTSAVVPEPKAERAQNYEFGIRTNQPEFYASLATYYTKFKNRIQSFTSILPGTINNTESFYQNVGGVDAYGAEFSGSYKPEFLDNYAYFNFSATYNVATFQQNLPDGTIIKGRNIPDSARWLLSGGITVEPTSWLVGNISAKYISKRYANFTNTFSIPGYAIFNAYVDVGDGISWGPLKSIKARFNLDNIFDEDVLSYISPQVTTDGFFRPMSPRTFQFTISAEY